MLLAKEITARFHSAAAADAAEADFQRRARGGVPDEIPEVALAGAPLAIGACSSRPAWCRRTSEALRLVEQGGVRIDGAVVSDKGLKLAAGTYRRAGRQAQVRARHAGPSRLSPGARRCRSAPT